ncbi:MAG TPA: hypothetical protein VKT33_04845 [Candidatus Angelobacter sp.]|nr:hypothetical protein [Candidatus Angelobacter sp.]
METPFQNPHQSPCAPDEVDKKVSEWKRITRASFSDSDYLPYGEGLIFKSTFDNHFKFTGKERDTESGLDDFGARF